MPDLNELSAQELGRRLRLARENAGIKQDDAAVVIGTSRPTLVSIEKGIRRVRMEEIQQLAHHYGVSVNALMRRESVHTDLVPRFRKLRDTEDVHTDEAFQLLNSLVKAEVELENILGIPKRHKYPPERGINEGDVRVLAETHARELRQQLGLGPGPIADIFSVIDFLGIRLCQRKLSSKSKVAGLFTFDENVGACIFINANHSLSRRSQTAAHELGHFVATRHIVEVLEDDEQFLSRDERYANAFGHAFLAPADTFSKSFDEVVQITGKITRRLIILLAHQFSISRQACTLRLEDLGLAKKGTWEWFASNGGITDEQAREVLGEVAQRNDPIQLEAAHVLSNRLSLMAHAAHKRGLMSEGQLAELLHVGRVELRAVIDQIEIEEKQSDELLKLV